MSQADSTLPSASPAAPRFSLFAILLVMSLVALLFGAIYGMPIYLGTWFLLAFNLVLAPISLAGTWCGRDYLRVACIGVLLPGAAGWWLLYQHYDTIEELKSEDPFAVPYNPYRNGDPFGAPAPAPPVGAAPAPPPPPPPVDYDYVPDNIRRLRFSLIANLIIAAAGAVCAIGTKWASDNQPNAPAERERQAA